MKTCILPKCNGETTHKARFCLECMTSLKADMRRRIIFYKDRMDCTENQREWQNNRNMFEKLTNAASRVSRGTWEQRIRLKNMRAS